MLPMKAIRLLIGETLATIAPLDQASALNRVALVSAPFTPDEDLVYADLTLANFDGSTAKTVALGAMQVGMDPVTGEQRITVPDIVGGWRWETTGITNLPQTIYGFALYDSTGPGPLLGVEVLPQPITLQEAGQEIIIGKVAISINQNPFNLP